jgi:molybdopterin converting factor small subunit
VIVTCYLPRTFLRAKDAPMAELELAEGATLADLVENLVARYGDALDRVLFDSRRRRKVIFVRNDHMAQLDEKLEPGDVIKIRGAIAGG